MYCHNEWVFSNKQYYVCVGIVCRPRWTLYNQLTAGVRQPGSKVYSVSAPSVADCLDECASHVTCVAVEVNQTVTSPWVGCSLVLNTTIYSNITSWFWTSCVSTYVIEQCPEAGQCTCFSQPSATPEVLSAEHGSL